MPYSTGGGGTITVATNFTGQTEFTGQTNISGPDSTTNVEIGSVANDANAGTGGTSTVIGNASTNSGNGTGVVIVGNANTSSASNDNVVVGNTNTAQGSGGHRLFGSGLTSSTGNRNLLIGNGLAAAAADVAIIGYAATGTGAVAGDFIIGSTGPANGYNNFYIGKGKVSTTAAASTINGTGGSGADNAGGDLILAAGKATGSGKGGNVVLQRAIRAGTSSTLQALAPAMFVCPTVTLGTTSAVAQTIATITTTSGSAGCISWFYTVTATNGTVYDIDGGTINIAWNNNAGTVAATAGTAVSTANSVASGTLVALPTVTVATNVVSIKVTPTWTVIVPTAVTCYATFLIHSAADVIVSA